jgi:Sigma-70 region 2
MAERAPARTYDGDARGPRPPERSLEDARLAELARAGDRDAFGQLYVRCADYVRGYVGARVPDQSAVQDLANAVWLGAWKSLPARTEPLQGEFREWLTGIARNKLADYRAEATAIAAWTSSTRPPMGVSCRTWSRPSPARALRTGSWPGRSSPGWPRSCEACRRRRGARSSRRGESTRWRRP